ncbi:YjjG family noncanonical pyrimidine nucleotidase [Tumebacillus lipolyticus]|uniref:YjjG family noncanonical pyrimidine nucleotidase n=1 Tax=Tumebacillus lipolyticus TaxID=1280370 RepID=A0ABW4ZWL4_9BACL
MKYEIILFDVDDTLFDFSMSEKTALQHTFLKFGMPTGLTDYHTTYKEISKILWSDLEKGNTTLSGLGVERFRRLFFEHSLEIDAAKFNSTYLGYLGKETVLVEGALELCNQLAGCRLAIITNGFTAVQKSRIGSSPLCNTFEHIIISEEVGSQKPESGIFDYAFSKLDFTDKEKVLIVGDSLTSDIQGGANYGIDTCWFNPNYEENSIGTRPTYEIHELMDLLRILRI